MKIVKSDLIIYMFWKEDLHRRDLRDLRHMSFLHVQNPVAPWFPFEERLFKPQIKKWAGVVNAQTRKKKDMKNSWKTEKSLSPLGI